MYITKSLFAAIGREIYDQDFMGEFEPEEWTTFFGNREVRIDYDALVPPQKKKFDEAFRKVTGSNMPEDFEGYVIFYK